MGLTDSYSQTHSEILMMKPVPTINQAYATLMSNESQRAAATSTGILGPSPNVNTGIYESTALYSSKTGNHQKYRKNYNLKCEYCNMKGYSKENCYKIIGYPSYFRFKKKGG